MVANKGLSVYDYGRFAAYLHSLHRIIPLLSVASNGRIVLDLGCSSGHFGEMIKGFLPNAIIIGVDIDLHSLKHRSAKWPLLADIRKVPLINSTADLALCLEVIEHMSKADALRTLSRIKHVLKNNGFLLISTPNRGSPTYISEKILHAILGRHYRGGHPSHVHIYNYNEIIELLRASGFEVIDALGYWILPITFYWIALASPRVVSFNWLQKLLMFTIRLEESILILAPRLGFVQIFLCANSSNRNLGTKKPRPRSYSGLVYLRARQPVAESISSCQFLFILRAW